MQAYLYIRFSTPKQEKGASKERQLEDCLALCERKGLPVAEIMDGYESRARTQAPAAQPGPPLCRP